MQVILINKNKSKQKQKQVGLFKVFFFEDIY